MPDPFAGPIKHAARMLGSASTGRLIIAALLCALLPVMGAVLSSQPLGDLLRFPLDTRAWDPAPASAKVTALANGAGLLLLAVLIWLIWPRRPAHHRLSPKPPRQVWPPYVWIGGLLLIAALIAVDGGAAHAAIGLVTLALTLFVNADTERRSGQSLISQRRGYFLALFPLSLIAGWLFLYWPNLFVRLWTYPAASEAIPFALGKSLDYATLVPALMSLRQWLASFSGLLTLTRRGRPLAPDGQRLAAPEGVLLIGLACLALAAGPIWPDLLYPLFVAAPAVLVIGIQIARSQTTSLAGLGAGDWSRPLLSSIAALLIMAVGQALNLLLGDAWLYQLPWLAGPMLLALPAPAWSVVIPLTLLGLWLADQIAEPFRQRPQQAPFRPSVSVKVSIADLLGDLKKRR